MNIIYAMRKDYLEKKGGDTFQMLATKKYIENSSATSCIEIVTDPEVIRRKNNVDIVHIFNIQLSELCFSFASAAKSIHAKVVISPIYWDLSYSKYVSAYYTLFANEIMLRTFLPFKSAFRNYFNPYHYLGKKYKENIRKTLNMADCLLPNSPEEGEIIRKQFTSSIKYISIPNAIDTKIHHYENICKYNNFVLEIGRIEPVKNQIGIVKGLFNEKQIPIVFIGSINKEFPKYISRLKTLSQERGNVYFIEEMAQENLADYYNKAKVHVLPSFRESPGLVSLEALYHGCPIVVSSEKYCPIKYYRFDKYAYVCDPFNTHSIHDAIMKAYAGVESHDVNIEEYFDFFSYKNSAKMTFTAYENLLY